MTTLRAAARLVAGAILLSAPAGCAPSSGPRPRAAPPPALETRTDVPDDHILVELDVPALRRATPLRQVLRLLETFWQTLRLAGGKSLPQSENPLACVPLDRLTTLRLGFRLNEDGSMGGLGFLTFRDSAAAAAAASGAAPETAPAATVLHCAAEALRKAGGTVLRTRVGGRPATQVLVSYQTQLTLWLAGRRSVGVAWLSPEALSQELVRARQTRVAATAAFHALARSPGPAPLLLVYSGRDAFPFHLSGMRAFEGALRAMALVVTPEGDAIALRWIVRTTSSREVSRLRDLFARAPALLRERDPAAAAAAARLEVTARGDRDLELRMRVGEAEVAGLLEELRQALAPSPPPRAAPRPLRP